MADTPLLAAIAAAASITGALVTALVSYRSSRRAGSEQRELEQQRADAQRTLEEFKTLLAEQASEKSARRAYEFEARKRLYHEIEPLLFVHNENANYVLNRIRNLARASRQGSLVAWLADPDGYYLRSTLHSFLVPIATVNIIRDRLTALDLSLDRSVERQYELGKAAARSFSRPEFFADQEPRFTGDLGMGSGSSAFRQGVLAGELQIAVDAVLDRTATALNIKSFAQFHKDLSNGEADVADMVEPFARSWRKFDPEGRPVFWRIIMAQLFIYRAIRLHRDRDLTDKDILARVKLSPSEHDEFAFSSLPEHRSEVDAAYRTGLLFLEATLEYRNPFL